MLWPKKNSYKESDNEKKFLRLENPPPPRSRHLFALQSSSYDLRIGTIADKNPAN